MLHEELLLLVDTCGEALLKGFVDDAMDLLGLLLVEGLSLVLLGAGLPPGFAAQVLAEFWVGTAFVVEIDCVSYFPGQQRCELVCGLSTGSGAIGFI